MDRGKSFFLGGIVIILYGIFLFAGYTLLIQKKPLSLPSLTFLQSKKDYTKGVTRLVDTDGTEIPFDIRWGGDVSRVIVSGVIDTPGLQTKLGHQRLMVAVPKDGAVARLSLFFPNYGKVLVYQVLNAHVGQTQRFEATPVENLAPLLHPDHQVLLKVDMDEHTFSAYPQPQLQTGKDVEFGPVTEITL